MEPTTAIRDAELVAELRADLDGGFADLVHVHQPGIYAGLYRMTGHGPIAEEIAQETFLRAYRALSTYDDERIAALSLSGWLWTIAINLCRDNRRRHTSTAELIDDERGVVDDEPLDDIAWNRRLAALPDTQRTAVVLRHVLDLRVADIAAITGRPVGTTKADISRGISRLRTTLDAEEAR